MKSESGSREAGVRSAGVFRLQTFGGCIVTQDGAPLDVLAGQRKLLALLAVLAASSEHGMSRDVLLSYLWPESSQQRARTSLNQLIHAVRQQLRAPDLLIGSSVLRLNPERMTSDVSQFRDAVRQRDHETAATLFRGPFLDGFYLRGADEFEMWVASTRADLARNLARSLESLAQAASERGETRIAVDWWRRLTDVEPLSAQAAMGLMRALEAAGERAGALEHARRYEQLVVRELGVALDPGIKEFAARLRALSSAPESMRSRPARRAAHAIVPSVAVLPFVDTSSDESDEHFSDGLTDELIVALGKVSGLRVTGRTSVFALKGRGLTTSAIGETLNVTTVLEGSVRRSADRLKVTAQLVSVVDDTVLWSHTFDGERRDIFAVQEEIARAIVRALPVQLAADANRLVHGPADLASYDLYLKGRHLLNTRLSNESLGLAARFFEQVITRDPSYAPAYAGLSHAHAYRGVFAYAPAHEAFAAAKTAARQALALDDRLADAHVSLGHVFFVYDYEWEAAEREFERAIDLEPANSTTRLIFAVCLQDQGRFDEAIAQLELARAIDPLAPFVGAVLGRVYVNARRPDEAIRHLRETLELAPELDVLHQQLGHAYLQKGMADEAIAAMRRAAELSGPRDAAQLAYVLAVTGRREEALRMVAEVLDTAKHPNSQAFHIAMAWAGLGDTDAAFRWLEQGYAERASFMDGVRITPAFDSLHFDPRWLHLLQQMNLDV
jgi:serine/threonine-protein kinase